MCVLWGLWLWAEPGHLFPQPYWPLLCSLSSLCSCCSCCHVLGNLLARCPELSPSGKPWNNMLRACLDWRKFGVYRYSRKEALRAFRTRKNKIPFRRKGCELCAFWRKKSIHLKSMEIWRLACPLCLSSCGCSRLPVSLSSLNSCVSNSLNFLFLCFEIS